MPDDPYSRVDYRRLIAWPQRIEREWPFLQRALGPPPGRLLDLGCGTGEHSRFLASHGYDVTGIDASESMLEKAREGEASDRVRFLLGDIVEVEALVEGQFDGAICLGNTLPHVGGRQALDTLMRGLAARVRPSAPFLLQILNYEKIIATRQRYLPLNFRDDDDGEIVFLRLMDIGQDGAITFTPSTLRYRPDGDPPLEVVSSRNVRLHGWRQGEIEAALEAAGFTDRQLYGTVGDVPYLPRDSSDLVIVARHL